MSQKLIYELLKELGGKATPKQISLLALQKYPGYTLHSYVHDRLQRLAKWGYVRKNIDGSWEIVRGTIFP